MNDSRSTKRPARVPEDAADEQFRADAKRLAKLMQTFLKDAPPTDVRADALDLCARITSA